MLRVIALHRIITVLCLVLLTSHALSADDPKKGADEKPAAQEQAAENAEEPGAEDPAFQISKDVEKVLVPLFKSIATADVSRATVSLSAETLNRGVVVDRQVSTYQIASKHPDKFTVYLKQPEQRTRVYCDGKELHVAVAPDAYFKLDQPMQVFDAVFDMPVPMGPYPEAIFALTFAGADPALTMLAGMESVEIVERTDFRGKIPSVHLKGVQDDGVVWDFWITEGDKPKPLRLLVDLTKMLRDNAKMKMQPGVTYELRCDFLTWRVTGEVDDSLFAYTPPAGAKEYASLDDYYRQMADVAENHPLNGQKVPRFNARLLSGKTLPAKDLQGKILVIDFWATWCKPCIESIPITEKACRESDEDDIVFLAVNVGEEAEKVNEFVKQQKWDLNIVLDEKMEVSKAFKADVIPLRVVVSKDGIAESIHYGYTGPEPLKARLADEFEVLAAGGKIASATPAKAKPASEKKPAAGKKPAPKKK